MNKYHFLRNFLCFLLAPASFRQREPEAKRFTGATNPSRSFRFLQMMTEDDATATTTTASSAKTEQLLNKYDEHNLSRNTNQLDEHPSRSFKYLQELTGQPQSTVKQSGIALEFAIRSNCLLFIV